MTDDRLLAALARLDGAEAPDPAFSDRLFATLVADLHFGEGREVPLPMRVRIGLRLGIWPLPTGHQALRLAWALAMVGLLLALALGTLLVAARLLARPSPPELVRLSREAWARPPAVQFTVSDPQGLTNVSSDGRGTWRSTSWDVSPGSYFLYDGERTGFYDADRLVWTVSPFESGGSPYPFNNAFAWTELAFPDLVARADIVRCDGAVDLGSAEVAGRAADHIACPALNMEYWLDRETRLTLRTLAREGSKYWLGPAGSDTVVEVTAFSALQPDPGQFAWTGPPGSRPVDAPVASRLLAVGERPPPWSGVTVNGQPFATDTLTGSAAVLFIEPSQRSGVALDGLVAAAARHPGVTPVLVGSAGRGTLVAYVAQHRATLDAVMDVDRGFSQAWGMTTTPALVLIGRDGTVTGMAAGRLTTGDIEAMVGALEAGRPVPTAAAEAPAPTPALVHPTPGTGTACTDQTTTCLPIGASIPEWSGLLMDGRPIGSRDIAGRPAVMWFTSMSCDGACPDWLGAALRDFARLQAAYAGRASFVIVSAGETVPGQTASELGKAGVRVPVVFDLEGAVSGSFRLTVGGVVVLDSDGRIVAQPVGDTAWPQVQEALDQLLPPPSPAPSR